MDIFMRLKDKFRRLSLRRLSFLPPNKEEWANMENLRESVREIDLDTDFSLEWVRNQLKIKELILNEDVRDFLNWPDIKRTMFYEGHPAEIEALQKSPRWIGLYADNTHEDKIGNPSRYSQYFSSSGNLIHHLYSLEQLFVNVPSFDLNKIKSVFEFGGGYGSLARLFLRLGWGGHYTIFDFQIFGLLQKYFLESTSVKKLVGNVSYVSDLKNITGEFDLFVSLWALSESPFILRDQILQKALLSAKCILIAYQNSFENRDNVEYFKLMTERYGNFKWLNYEIQYIPGNYYLIGYKQN